MNAPEGSLVAIGVGNVLLGDDGVGVRVIEGLRAGSERDPRAMPADSRLVDGGTLGLDLLHLVRGSRGVVLVDAVRLGGPVGRVSVLSGDAVLSLGGAPNGDPGSAVGELLAVGRVMGWLPASVAVVGVEVEDLEPGARLTPAVDAAIPVAMEAVRAELRRMDGLPTTGTSGGGATGSAGTMA